MHAPSSNLSAPLPAQKCNKIMDSSFLVLYTIMAVIIFFGNLLTCIVFLSKPRLRATYMNVFLISLAMSDFLVSVLVFPGFTILCFSCVTAVWVRFHSTCFTLEGIKDYVLLVNVFNILCITFDRYVAVLQPMKYNSKINKKSVIALLVFAWTIPLPLAYMKALLVAANPKIFLQEVNRSIYDDVSVVVFIILPMCIIVAVNVLIVNVIRKQITRINALGNSHSNSYQNNLSNNLQSHNSLENSSSQLHDADIVQYQPPVSRDTPLAEEVSSTVQGSHHNDDGITENSVINSAINYDVHVQNENKAHESCDHDIGDEPIKVEQKQEEKEETLRLSLRPVPTSSITKRLVKFARQMKENRGTRSCLAVSAIFVICWIPWSVFNVLRIFSLSLGRSNVDLVEKISLLFLYFQSMTNAFVYSLYRKDFREAAKDLLKKVN